MIRNRKTAFSKLIVLPILIWHLCWAEDFQPDDQGALERFQESIASLRPLVSRKQNTPDELPLLSKIGELLNRIAAIQFRLIYKDENSSKNETKKLEYRKTLEELIQTESTLISKFPTSPEVSRYYYLRAKAFQEMDGTQHAIEDYKFLIDHFPENSDIISAHFNLHELLSKSQDFRTSMEYLKKMKSPEKDKKVHSLYLDSLAFDHYSIRQYQEAFDLLKEEFKLFPANSSNPDNQYEKDRILKTVALFYATAIEQKISGFSGPEFIPFMLRFDLGDNHSKAFHQFSTLLRAKNLDSEFESFKTAAFGRKPSLSQADTLSILTDSIEIEISRKNFSSLQDTFLLLQEHLKRYLSDTQKSPNRGKLLSVVSDVALRLQELYLKEKDPGYKSKIEGSLITLYTSILKINTDLKSKGQIYFNLAEIYFQKKQYDDAYKIYEWILSPSNKKSQDLVVVEKAKSLVISSKYEGLQAAGKFPKTISPMSGSENSHEMLSKDETQWIQWLISYRKELNTQKTERKVIEQIQSYLFEASRLAYSQKRIFLALQLINEFLLEDEKSEIFPAAASLAIDTYVASKEWKKASDLGEIILKKLVGSSSAFKQKIEQLVGDIQFKTVENHYKNKNFKEALAQAEIFLSKYRTNSHSPDVLSLAGHSAQSLGNRELALGFFSRLASDKSTSARKSSAFLSRASIAEEQFKYELALDDYLAFIRTPQAIESLSPNEANDLRKKILYYSWFTNDSKRIQGVLEDQRICQVSIAEDCYKIETLYNLSWSNPPLGNRSRTLSSSNVPSKNFLDRLLAYNHCQTLSIEKRGQVIQELLQGWESQDWALQFSVLPKMIFSTRKCLEASRSDIRRLSALSLNKAVISKRSELIQKFEPVLAALTAFPSAEIRAETLSQWAGIYSDFYKDLRSLPAPSGLGKQDLLVFEKTLDDIGMPFLEKAKNYRSKALDLARETGVGGAILFDVAREAYSEHPGLQKELALSKPEAPFAPNLESLRFLNCDSQWLNSFESAAHQKNSLKLAYLLQTAISRNILTPAGQQVARGIAFGIVNAPSEALLEFQDSLGGLPPEQKPAALAPISLISYLSRSTVKTKPSLEQLSSTSSEEQRNRLISNSSARILSKAIEWSQADVPSSFRREFESRGDKK